MNYTAPFPDALLGVTAGPGMLFGLMLLCAIVGGYAARSVHAPRVVGLIISGIALKLVLTTWFASSPERSEMLLGAQAPLEAVRDLALGLILFTIGGVFERSRLRATAARVSRIAALEIGLVLVFVLVGCGVAALATGTGGSWRDAVTLGLLLGTAAIATAPAATLLVLQEYDAKGPITDTILGLTGVNNIVCIVLFHAVFLTLAWCGMLPTHGAESPNLLLDLLMTTLGSVLLGLVLGLLISLVHTKLPLTETLIVFLGFFVLLGASERWLLSHGSGLSYNFLLTALVMGGVFSNIAIDAQKLEQTLRVVGAPIFAVFFVMAGYDLHMADLRHMGWVGLAYVVFRFAGKELGCRLGVRWAGAPHRTGGRLGEALLCQAAVVIGLASFVEHYWASPSAKQFSTIILGSVVVFELVGPLLLKRRVVQGGEVKAITLLSRAKPGADRVSFLRLAIQPLLHGVGAGRRQGSTDARDMQVRHIMRTNVQVIPASASLDEVLHFIERSTYNHFPVVYEDGDVAGVIHFSDVRDVIYDPTLRDLVTAVDLADPDSAVVPPDMALTHLLEIFSGTNVGVLPVAESSGSKRILGVVEQRDLLRALHLSEQSK